MVSSPNTDLWDGLFYLYLGIALVVGAAVIAWLVVSLVKFRDRPGAPTPKDAPIPGVLPAERGHVLWVYVMTGAIAAIMFGLAFSTISAVEEVEHPPKDMPQVPIDVYGSQFTWTFYHESPEGIPLREIASLTVPEKTAVVTRVMSDDVWHNFALPNFRVRVDAIPGETNHIWFAGDEVGEDHVACVMLCGAQHATMRAAVHVVSQADYDKWMADHTKSEVDRYARSASIAQVTLGAGGAPTASNTTVSWHLAKGKTTFEPAWGGVLVNLTNSDAAPHTVRVGERAVTVPAGATQTVFARALPGPLAVATDAGTLTLTITEGKP